jgi:PmbA protein
MEGAFESWELCFIKERDKRYEAAEGTLLTMEVKEEEGVSLRCIRDGKMCFSYTFAQDGEKAASELLANVEALTPFLEKDPNHVFPAASGRYPDLDIFDGQGLATADDAKIASLLEMESTIRAHDPRIVTTRNCELQESELHVGVINSNGLDAQAAKTVYALSAMAVAREGSDEVSWYDWSWASRYGELDGRKLGLKVAGKALSFLSGQVLDTGVYRGLLTPGCACQVLEMLSPSFLGENLYKNKTRLKEKTGAKCFSDLLTIIDSGMRGIGALPFDGEGVPSQDNVLVEGGLFHGFLYDTYYGKLMNGASTGNAARSGVKDPPRCATKGLFIAEGTGEGLTPDGEWIVLEELMGTHTANGVTGDFSVGAIGHFHKGGSVVPVQGVMLSGNLFELLGQVKGVGKDLTFYGSYGSPTLYIEGLRISGK